MYNKVILIGHLGADPDIRNTQDGRKIANLRIATSESWKDKNSGERKQRTQWHTIAIFNEGLAKVAEQYLKKGSLVQVEGQLETRKWQDQSGNDRYSTEVVLRQFRGELTMLGGKGENSGSDSGSSGSNESSPKNNNSGGGASGGGAMGLDDEIPFAPEFR